MTGFTNITHHHHVTQSSHSINAIGPAPLWSGRKREHCSNITEANAVLCFSNLLTYSTATKPAHAVLAQPRGGTTLVLPVDSGI
jgi:hypothetical protein